MDFPSRAVSVSAGGRSAWLLALLLGLVLVGSALRFHKLGADGLWSDELFTSSMVLQHPADEGLASFRRISVFEIRPEDSFWSAKGGEQSPPLFELFSKLSVACLGRTEFALRFVSALSGVLFLVFLAVRAARERDPLFRAGLVLTLLLSSLSPPLVEYAQEGRAYGLGVALTGVLCVLWFERLRAGLLRAPLPRLPELACMLLACHVHYNALAFSGLLLLIYSYAALCTGRAREIARLALVPLGCIPWVALNAHTILFTSAGGVRWRDFTATEALMGALRSILLLLGPSGVVLSLFLLWALFGVQFVRERPAEKGRGLLGYALISLFLVNTLMVAMITMRSGMEHPRYYLFALPLVHLALGLGFVALPMRFVLKLIPLGIFLAASGSEVRAYYAERNEGYREITRWLREQVEADAQVVYTWGPNLAMYRFYLERYFDDDADTRALAISSAGEAPALCARLGKARQIALIGHASHRPLLSALYDACGTRYALRSEKELRSVVGQVWEQR
jgi:hypothetical protein